MLDLIARLQATKLKKSETACQVKLRHSMDMITSTLVLKQQQKRCLKQLTEQRIRDLEAALEKTSLSVRFQLKPDNLIRFYTGFPSYQVLVTTFFFLRPTAEKVYSWSQMKRLRNKDSTEIDKLRHALRACKLNLFDQFVLCLQKLRVGTLNHVLADNFDISLATVTRIFLSWICLLYTSPSPRDGLLSRMPSSA